MKLSNYAFTVSFFPGDHSVFVGLRGGIVQVFTYDLKKKTERTVYKSHISKVRVSPDKKILIGGGDKSNELLLLNNKLMVEKSISLKSNVCSLVWLNQELVIAGLVNGDIACLNIKDGKHVLLSGHKGYHVEALGVSQDMSALYSGALDGSIKCFALGKILKKIK